MFFFSLIINENNAKDTVVALALFTTLNRQRNKDIISFIAHNHCMSTGTEKSKHTQANSCNELQTNLKWDDFRLFFLFVFFFIKAYSNFSFSRMFRFSLQHLMPYLPELILPAPVHIDLLIQNVSIFFPFSSSHYPKFLVSYVYLTMK